MGTSLRLGAEREVIIKRMGKAFNFNDWVKRKFDKEFINEEFISNLIEDEERSLLSKKALLKEIINEKTRVTSRERSYLSQTKEILRQYGKDSNQIDMRFAGYKNTFNKKYISMGDFISLVEGL